MSQGGGRFRRCAATADNPAEIRRYHRRVMPFPVKTCVVCGEDFELRPDKPGFANRCPRCIEPEAEESDVEAHKDETERRNESEINAERRRVIRDMLYRKDS